MFRAHYYEQFEILIREYNLTNFFIIVIQNFFNYFFQPTIFNLSNFQDLVLIFENSLRFIFIFFIVYKLFLNFENKSLFLILFFMYLIMEVIYAQATVNYGTASRHHVPSVGYLILLVFFPSKRKIIKF